MASQNEPDSSAVRIRAMRPSDLDEVHQLIQAAWNNNYAGFLPQRVIDSFFAGSPFDSSYSAGAGKLHKLVAEQGDSIVGYVAACERAEPGVGEVASLYVHPELQGQKVGAMLFSSATSLLGVLGCRELWVFTFRENGANHFYEKMGCQLFRTDDWYSIGNEKFPVNGYRLMIPATN